MIRESGSAAKIKAAKMRLSAVVLFACLLSSLVSTSNWPTLAEPAEKNEESSPNKAPTVLKGGVQYLVPKGTPIKLKLATVPTNGMRLLDRDLDGNLYPAKVGDVITAKTSEDIYVDDNKVIPEGTVFHGRVSGVVPPRRVRRPGWLQISFDGFTTPDGRSFAFRAEADNFKPSTPKTKLKGFGIIAAHAAGGAIVGALVAYQLCGLQNTIAMHGYNIAGGAAGGALLATAFAIAKHGPQAVLEPGDDLNMQINTDLLMPGAVDATLKTAKQNRDGIDIKIGSTKLLRDGFGGRILQVDLTVDNQTDDTLNSIDLFCEDTNGNRCALVAGPEEASEFLFEVEPHSTRQEMVNFQLEFPKLKRHLVWLDHNTREVCWRGAVP